jgi:hypothetical protein
MHMAILQTPLHGYLHITQKTSYYYYFLNALFAVAQNQA